MNELTIVVPCYNERDCVDACHERLDRVCRQTKLQDYEIIFVNDGSTAARAFWRSMQTCKIRPNSYRT
jgi:glycosyltransferase involved in cell wall biosynthesis